MITLSLSSVCLLEMHPTSLPVQTRGVLAQITCHISHFLTRSAMQCVLCACVCAKRTSMRACVVRVEF